MSLQQETIPTHRIEKEPPDILRVAIVVADYPTLSQTFIDRLISELGAIENFQISVLVVGSFNKTAASALQLGNNSDSINIHHLGEAQTKLQRLMSGFSVASKGFIRAPLLTLKCLNFFKYGKHALKFKILRLALLLKKAGPQHVIHAQFLSLGPALSACKQIGVTGNAKLLASARGADLTVHNLITDQDLSLMQGRGMKILTVSHRLGAILMDRGYNADLNSLAVSGLDVASYNFLSPSLRTPSSPQIRMLFVGRLIEKKGLQLALEGLSQLSQQALNFHLTIIGTGPLEDSLKTFCLEASLNDHVSFRGPMPHEQVKAEFQSTHMLLVPSQTGPNGDSEGIPNVAKEAMASGTIVLASDHAGMGELIDDRQTGFLFCEGSLSSFQKQLLHCISMRSSWDDIATMARDKVKQDFDTSAMLKSILEAYA